MIKNEIYYYDTHYLDINFLRFPRVCYYLDIDIDKDLDSETDINMYIYIYMDMDMDTDIYIYTDETSKVETGLSAD